MNTSANSSATTSDKSSVYHYICGKTADELENEFVKIIRELRKDGGISRYNCRINISQTQQLMKRKNA